MQPVSPSRVRPLPSPHGPGLPLGTAEPRLTELLGGPGSAPRALHPAPRALHLGGLMAASAAYLVAALAARSTGPVLVVTADAHARDDLLLDLDAFGHPDPAVLPTWPRDAAGTPPDAETLAARTQALERLRAARHGGGGAGLLVVASLGALLQPVPASAVIDAAALHLARGAVQRLPVLLEHLALCGYARVPSVEAPGEFAARGGVLDVWPLGRGAPVRLDFLGDEIESLHEMDPATQRSGLAREHVDLLVLPPERVRTPDDGAGRALLTAHLPTGARVVLQDAEALAAEAARLGAQQGGETRRALSTLQAALHAFPVLELSPAPLGASGDLDLEVGSADAVRGVAALRPDAVERAALEPQAARTQRLVAAFQALARRVEHIVVYRRAPGEEERLAELLREHAPELAVRFAEGALTRSFVFGPTRTAHVAYDDLADLPVRDRRRSSARSKRRPLTDFLELEPGVPVVHMHHGVGLFRGLVMLEGSDGPGEFLRVDFAEGTTVYVPVARIDLVQRYVGTGQRPRLARLGGSDWESKRKRVEAAVEELAEELLALQASRHRRRTAPCPPDGPWQAEFEGAFPYPLTPDQETRRARPPRPTWRASGRWTACCAATSATARPRWRCAPRSRPSTAGKQVAVLVPTTVLAEQHCAPSASAWPPIPFASSAVAASATREQQRDRSRAWRPARWTSSSARTACCSKDVRFKDLGLVVIDEEQRFGVKHKERLKALRAEVDVLTLTATPIPRTLHMALLGHARHQRTSTRRRQDRLPIETQRRASTTTS